MCPSTKLQTLTCIIFHQDARFSVCLSTVPDLLHLSSFFLLCLIQSVVSMFIKAAEPVYTVSLLAGPAPCPSYLPDYHTWTSSTNRPMLHKTSAQPSSLCQIVSVLTGNSVTASSASFPVLACLPSSCHVQLCLSLFVSVTTGPALPLSSPPALHIPLVFKGNPVSN